MFFITAIIANRTGRMRSCHVIKWFTFLHCVEVSKLPCLFLDPWMLDWEVQILGNSKTFKRYQTLQFRLFDGNWIGKTLWFFRRLTFTFEEKFHNENIWMRRHWKDTESNDGAIEPTPFSPSYFQYILVLSVYLFSVHFMYNCYHIRFLDCCMGFDTG